MASSSTSPRDIPFEDDEIFETMTVAFDYNADHLDLDSGIDLLGILIADIEPAAGGVKATLLGIWKNFGQIRIIRAKKNVYSIRVGSQKLATRLINGGPWNVKGFCLSITQWPLYQSIDEIEPNRATYWIHAHGIPREMLSVANGRKLGSLLGSVIDVEDPSLVGNRGFLRLRIDFDAHKPLATSCFLPYHAGTKKIRLQYELLKSFCHHCGRLGHMKSVCNYQVHPTLLRLGVVYDHTLVAEVVQRPAHTMPYHPREFPYCPATNVRSLRHIPRPQTSNEPELQHGHRSEPTSQCLTKNNQAPHPHSSLHAPDTRSNSHTPTFSECGQRERHDMWNSDTNDTIFRNGSVTVAINGPNMHSPTWDDPNAFPPWAFKNKLDVERANSFFPVPAFNNDRVLASLPSSTITIEDVTPHEKPTSLLSTKPTSQRKRKAKRVFSDVSAACDAEVSQPKKVRPPVSPGLRLSTHGGRRGSRGGTGGTGRSSSNGRGRGKKLPPINEGRSFQINFGGSTNDMTKCWDMDTNGMEDLTHLQGCGGWPRSAARNQ